MTTRNITVPMQDSSVGWPDDTPFRLTWTRRKANGATINVGQLQLIVHTGTHTYALFHSVGKMSASRRRIVHYLSKDHRPCRRQRPPRPPQMQRARVPMANRLQTVPASGCSSATTGDSSGGERTTHSNNPPASCLSSSPIAPPFPNAEPQVEFALLAAFGPAHDEQIVAPKQFSHHWCDFLDEDEAPSTKRSQEPRSRGQRARPPPQFPNSTPPPSALNCSISINPCSILGRDDILFEGFFRLGDAFGQVEYEIAFAKSLGELDQFADEFFQDLLGLVRIEHVHDLRCSRLECSSPSHAVHPYSNGYARTIPWWS